MSSQESLLSFDRYWLILKRRGMPALGIFLPTFFITSVALSLKKPSYEAYGKLQFQRTNILSSLTGVGTEIGKLEPVVQDSRSNPLNTEAEVILSVPVITKTIDKLNLKNSKGLPMEYKDLLAKLTVTDVSKTDVLNISYKDSNSKLAAEVVNTLMTIYLEHNIASHRSAAAAARKFLEKQVPNAELVVRKLEAEVREFKEKYQVFAIQEEGTKTIEIITELQKKIGETKSRIADINAQNKAIREQLNMTSQEAVVMTSLSQSTAVQDILKEVRQVELQLAGRRVVLQDTHPEIINLEHKLESLRAILQKRTTEITRYGKTAIPENLQVGELQQNLTARLVEFESTRMGLAGELFTLNNLLMNYRERLRNLPKLEQQQRELERKLQASQSTYSLLLQRLQESRIAENQNVGNARMISEALVPGEPISSDSIAYTSGVLIASLTSLAGIYLLEAKDKSIKTVEEAKELTRLTLLGVIPSYSKSKKSIRHTQEPELSSSSRLFVRDTPRSPISEAYRMLRANLKFMSADKELKVIVVTSSVPKEGKSTVAANLAIAMAQMERKVLLVDGDLHRPAQHEIWQLTNREGLSNVIVGQAEIMKAIKNVIDNLDVLTSGVVPPSPASLLDSKRMASLIESFSSYYDFVIIDAPSLNLAADAATLGQMADGVLLVVRPGVVDSVNATAACEILEKSGQNVLGQVVNAVVLQNERHMKYYFEEEYQVQDSSRQSVTVNVAQ